MDIVTNSPVQNTDAVMDCNFDFLLRIRSQQDSFTKSQKKIFSFLNSHPEEILTNSITSLAKRIGTTPPTLTRFCQLIHYKGFSDLKFCMEKNLSSPFISDKEILQTDSVSLIKKKLLEIDTEALSDSLQLLDDKYVERAVQAICHADMVHIYADGGPGASANYAYQLFLQIGIPCNYFTDMRLALMALPHLKKNDVAIGITFSGDSVSVIDAIKHAKECHVCTVGITAFTNSTLAKIVSIPLCYSMNKDDLRYLHVARMCEIAIIGLLQSAIVNYIPQKTNNILFSKKSIEKARRK